MKLDIEITRQDYYEFNKFYALKTRLKKMITINLLLLFLVLFYFNQDGFKFTTTSTFLVVCIVMYPCAIFFSIRQLKNVPLDGSPVLGPKQLDFTDETINYKGRMDEGSIKWSAIKSIESGKTAFYLFMDAQIAVIVPKRFFKSTDEQERFVEFVKGKLSAQGK